MKTSKKANPLEIKCLTLLLVIAFFSFAMGVLTPIMTITKLIFIENSFSIISGLSDLLAQEKYMLFLLITSLSLVLPLIKMLLLAWVLCSKSLTSSLTKPIHLIHQFGRWAMLDVLVVAILLVAVKLGAIASVDIHSGLYWFASSVLITMWVTHRTLKIVQT